MKSKVSMIVAVVTLVGAAVLGGWVLLGHDKDGPGPSAVPVPAPGQSTPDRSASPGGSPSAEPDAGVTAFKIPAGTVNPLTGTSYCGTAKLLAIYSHQGYGLSQHDGILDGERFATRLKVIAAAYERLAVQAGRGSGTGDVAASWRALAEATRATEEKLRVVGLQALSQPMILKYAELKKVIDLELPRATSTLRKVCGFSPTVFAS